MRIIWLIFGLFVLGLGCLGVVLPLLPTVPFILLAAFCFTKSSNRLHNWLLTHRLFGKMIQNWRQSGAISTSAKKMATLSIALVFSTLVALILGKSVVERDRFVFSTHRGHRRDRSNHPRIDTNLQHHLIDLSFEEAQKSGCGDLILLPREGARQ